jgi:tRNA G18 (ribose-2'-O)-methylase SpoU
VEVGLRGYFGIGAEGISKATNLGSLMRSAHAFGASFLFTVAAACRLGEAGRTDTSEAEKAVPLYAFSDVGALLLPRGCQLIGVEIIDEAIDLPSFHHPRCAAYVFGSERGQLSAAMLGRCAHVVRIPTRFAINLGTAAAIVMYDRVVSLGRFARRPERPGGPIEALAEPVFGAPRFRKQPPSPGLMPRLRRRDGS